MSSDANVQKNAGSVGKRVAGYNDIQYRFDAASAACNFSSAKLVSPKQGVSVPNYGPRKNVPKALAETGPQTTARVIRECQAAFSGLMKSIGNAANVYQRRELDRTSAPAMRYSSGKELAIETRDILRRQMAITEFGMRWEPTRQVFYGAGKIFANEGSTETVPTHDLAHLLVGACGNLPWCPEGGQEEVRLAEYYAVFLENLFDKVYGYVVAGAFNAERVLHEAITYARWFVEVHYAPFPLPAEEAYRRFCWNMNVQAISRLSPVFFALKRVERTFPEYRDQIWELHFNTGDAPPPEQVAVICPDKT